jgi:hypothetical protein
MCAALLRAGAARPGPARSSYAPEPSEPAVTERQTATKDCRRNVREKMSVGQSPWLPKRAAKQICILMRAVASSVLG